MSNHFIDGPGIENELSQRWNWISEAVTTQFLQKLGIDPIRITAVLASKN